jgi:hypothetical protein
MRRTTPCRWSVVPCVPLPTAGPRLRSCTKDVIATADGLAMGAVSAPHPALGNFNGYEWIAFAGAHAARHAAQVREILAQ